jgi:hypothetical protein
VLHHSIWHAAQHWLLPAAVMLLLLLRTLIATDSLVFLSLPRLTTAKPADVCIPSAADDQWQDRQTSGSCLVLQSQMAALHAICYSPPTPTVSPTSYRSKKS